MTPQAALKDISAELQTAQLTPMMQQYWNFKIEHPY
ncbi:MAG: hypothetical protein JWM96_1151 [Alphaproteobacteria bacterium]|nr:hypothetical protein [Alphaproteobacteria bacterium]